MDEPVPSFAQLTRKISRERGFECAHYKEKCIKRRIAVRMRARGVHTYGDYARLLDTDGAEYDRLLDALTINVTRLFRNAEVYTSVAARVVPDLWARATDRVRVWSAGCSSGEEPYSLAILFHRHAAMQRDWAGLHRIEIVGTEIDRACLIAAERGVFEESDFAETPPELRTRYFAGERPFTVDPGIRRMVRFERRDLLTAPPPVEGGLLDLIVCRNVLIYFDRPTQERIFEMFHRALAPGGFLVLGKVESLFGPTRGCFTPVDARQRIFRHA